MAGDWDLSKIISGVKRAGKEIRKGAADGLGEWAEYVLQEADQLVPIEEGTLSRSGATEVDRDNLKAAVGYGKGGAAAYARRQHEEMDWHHDQGRQAKFLEQPAVASGPVGEQLIGNAIRRRLS